VIPSHFLGEALLIDLVEPSPKHPWGEESFYNKQMKKLKVFPAVRYFHFTSTLLAWLLAGFE